MKKSSLLLRLEGGGVREQDKLDRREEVRLSGSISPHDHIVPLVEGAYDSPFTIGLEPLQNHFRYIHRWEISATLPSIKSSPYVRVGAMLQGVRLYNKFHQKVSEFPKGLKSFLG